MTVFSTTARSGTRAPASSTDLVTRAPEPITAPGPTTEAAMRAPVCKKEDHRAAPEGDTYNHLLVLAENEEGYRNLTKICSEASLHGFYYKPRVSKKFLAEHSKGLIGLSACLKGEVAERLTEGKYEAARTGRRHPQRHLRQQAISILEIQDQGLRKRSAFTTICSGWRRNSASPWSLPTTATTSAKTIRTRRT